MSHVTKIELEIKDLTALEAACKELGLEFVKQPTYRWWGRYMGDSPLPEGFAKEDLGKCEFAIRVPGNKEAYEVGVVKRRDGKAGYTLLYDYWSGGYGLVDKIGQGASKLTQGYSVQVAKRWARRNGYRVSVTQGTNGKQVITARK